MPIRIEIEPDGRIEIMRSWVNDPMTRFLSFSDLDTAVRVLRYLIRREIRRVEANRFVPQSEKEAKVALKIMHRRASDATRQKGR